MNLNFAENFKKYRKQKGITQERIAEELGVSGQSVSRWELGVCYPDLELLPGIANYFGISIDILLSNDKDSREKAQNEFYKVLNSMTESEKRIEFILEYCRKYPDDDSYCVCLMNEIVYWTSEDKAVERYMPIVRKKAEQLLQTDKRDFVIQAMSAICDDCELDRWLDLAPYTGFSRRYCLNNRASAKNDHKLWYIQNGLEMFEHFADLLDRRCPDPMGSQIKSRFQLDVMKTIRSFGNGEVPDGWKFFYAYKQLVYAACLFGNGEYAEAWKNFDSGIEMCSYIFYLEDEWLDIGGALFSELKVNKSWTYAMDKEGNKHKLFAVHHISFSEIEIIYSLLTNPRWAWFDSVRNTEKYKHAVDVIKEMADKNAEN
ncbi:MAG: helix-turn-helix transcriptional regulator [Ruminococcaceae bacterium]|nr:helix-turn-helix transcriptional regulator [Oscillospiraceae bacterium]